MRCRSFPKNTGQACCRRGHTSAPLGSRLVRRTNRRGTREPCRGGSHRCKRRRASRARNPHRRRTGLAVRSGRTESLSYRAHRSDTGLVPWRRTRRRTCSSSSFVARTRPDSRPRAPRTGARDIRSARMSPHDRPGSRRDPAPRCTPKARTHSHRRRSRGTQPIDTSRVPFEPTLLEGEPPAN